MAWESEASLGYKLTGEDGERSKESYSLRCLQNFVQTFNRENIPLELCCLYQFKNCGSSALPHPLEGALASLPHPIAPESETAELVPSPWQMPEPPLAPLLCVRAEPQGFRLPGCWPFCWDWNPSYTISI